MPQTLGYSLADSPVGLLAWIYEKLVTWTDEYPWDDDEGLLSILRSSMSTYSTHYSPHLDFNLPVLAIGSSRLRTHLLRNDQRWQFRRHSFREDLELHPCWSESLPAGAHLCT